MRRGTETGEKEGKGNKRVNAWGVWEKRTPVYYCCNFSVSLKLCQNFFLIFLVNYNEVLLQTQQKGPN